MLYMILEKFHEGKEKLLYERFEQKGRMMPEGLHYVNSWIDEKLTVCYQVMETDSIEKLYEWIAHWNDLADFEVIPVVSSQEAKQRVFKN